MGKSDEWTINRAMSLYRDIFSRKMPYESGRVNTMRTALQEAIERGKAEQQARIAVLEARLETSAENCATYRAAADADVVILLDRLRNPDEALVEAGRTAVAAKAGAVGCGSPCPTPFECRCQGAAFAVFDALARTLAENSE